MARDLRLRVVAEGVEKLEELEFLRAHQCDEVQGFYFSRPVPPQQFVKLLSNGIPEASVTQGSLLTAFSNVVYRNSSL